MNTCVCVLACLSLNDKIRTVATLPDKRPSIKHWKGDIKKDRKEVVKKKRERQDNCSLFYHASELMQLVTI